jgi:hypothetical protein
MLEKHAERLDHAQPMLESTRSVGDSVLHNALRLKRFVIEVLKAVAKCWAFFKDVHFSWFVIIPFLSQLAPFGKVSALLLWGLFFLPILIVITFRTLDSMFGLSNMDSGPQAWIASSLSRAVPSAPNNVPARLHERPGSYAALQSRTVTVSPRRHHATRPLRSRRPGLW